jgi:hypothetical protein
MIPWEPFAGTSPSCAVLGLGNALKGDPVALELPPGSAADVEMLSGGKWVECIEIPRPRSRPAGADGLPILSGFEAWLLNQRRHYRAAGEAALREAALALLGGGEAERAIDIATRLVAIDPLVESTKGC